LLLRCLHCASRLRGESLTRSARLALHRSPVRLHRSPVGLTLRRATEARLTLLRSVPLRWLRVGLLRSGRREARLPRRRLAVSLGRLVICLRRLTVLLGRLPILLLRISLLGLAILLLGRLSGGLLLLLLLLLGGSGRGDLRLNLRRQPTISHHLRAVKPLARLGLRRLPLLRVALLRVAGLSGVGRTRRVSAAGGLIHEVLLRCTSSAQVWAMAGAEAGRV
jgi:hypothetical protein